MSFGGGEIKQYRVIPFVATIAEYIANPSFTPRQGEFCMEVGGVATFVKAGDGVTPYLSLPYIFSGGSGGTANFDAVLHTGNFAHGIPAVVDDPFSAPHTGGRTHHWWDGFTVSDYATGADTFIQLQTDEGGFNYGYLRLLTTTGTATFYADYKTLIVGATSGSHLSFDAPTEVLTIKNNTNESASLYGGTSARLKLYDAADGVHIAYWGAPFSGALTADRNYYPPDESGTIVLHTTKDAINVDDGATHVSILDTDGLLVNSGVNHCASLKANSGQGQLMLRDNTGSKTVTILSTTLTANRVYLTPDRPGSLIALYGDQTHPTFTAGVGAGTSPTITFIGKSDDTSGVISIISGAGASVSNVWVTVHYNNAYDVAPNVIIHAHNDVSRGSNGFYARNFTTSGFDIYAASGPIVGGTQEWTYEVSR